MARRQSFGVSAATAAWDILHEAPRAYAHGIINFFGGIRRSNSPSFALRATEGLSDAFIPGLTPAVFCVGG